MSPRRTAQPEPWMLFAFPLAIALPIVAAILLGGPIAGFAIAVLVAAVIVTAAVRMAPRGPSARREAGRDGAWRAAAARRSLAPGLVAIVGAAMILATTGTADIIGWGVLAIAITLAISLAFLEIGYSEDRARAAERRRRSRMSPPRGGGPRPAR